MCNTLLTLRFKIMYMIFFSLKKLSVVVKYFEDTKDRNCIFWPVDCKIPK